MASSSAPMQEVMLEFRAGRMFMEGSRVIPDKRKGLVRLAKGEEGLVHFQWLDRTLNKVEENQIVFPDEAAFEKVHQSSERVYILKFTSDDRKLFFWMQEAAPDGDAQLCSSVNYYINRPLELVEDEPEASVPLPTSDMSEDMANEVSSRAGNMDTTSLLRSLGSEVSSFGPVQLADLQRILSNIEPEGAEDAGLGLGDILKPDLVVPLMETMPLDQQLRTYLPEGEWTADDVADLLQSPPFRQQVESFTYVLRTGQIDLSQFGIDPSKYKFTVVSFLEALEDSVGKTNNSMLEPSAAASGFPNQDENKDGGHETCADGDKMDES